LGGGATTSFGPASRAGLHTSAEMTRNKRRYQHGSQSGMTASTAIQKQPSRGGGSRYHGTMPKPMEGGFK